MNKQIIEDLKETENTLYDTIEMATCHHISLQTEPTECIRPRLNPKVKTINFEATSTVTNLPLWGAGIHAELYGNPYAFLSFLL